MIGPIHSGVGGKDKYYFYFHVSGKMTVSGRGIYSSFGFDFLPGPAFDFLPNLYMSKLNKILIFEFQK